MTKKKQGFAALSPERMREAASIGGRAAHAGGHAHEWNKTQARDAARLSAAVRAAPWWSDSSGRIELRITREDYMGCSTPGRDSEMYVRAAMLRPYLARQLARVDRQWLHLMLSEYGAWEDHELADHSANLRRLVWLASGDLREQQHG